ncbi:fimbrial protein [Photorhabdus antumapuensis]|uniref:fimbrial protein n=1 Tax=Photorhabdus antumapuensis TaxID=2862867 RepID=UPI001CED0F86|nr:hypothetical protein [Photorhabdus antumapuensis]MCA6220421.1 hypothetical protein [Photorhabdus antumapuensis]
MKKQILKTSVLAAVLLSMGMGMAHAVDLASSQVTVTGKVAASTCVLNLEANGKKITDTLNLGQANKTDFVTNDELVKPQDLTVSLTSCSGDQFNTSNQYAAGAQLKISGSNVDSNKYFGLKDGVAVGIKNADKFVENGNGLDFVNANTADAALKPLVLKVGLVAKDKDAVGAATVNAPLTFTLVSK